MSAARRMVGGVEVDRAVWDEILENVRRLGERRIQIGVLRDAAHEGPAGTHGAPSLVAIAATHEFGAPDLGIPERSYIRSTFHEHKKAELVAMKTKLALAVCRNRMSSDQALGLLGSFAQEAVKASISERLIKQDLSPMTIARKRAKANGRGGDDPSTALVDTGQLRASITWAYEDAP